MHAGTPGGGQAQIADQPAKEAREDRRKARLAIAPRDSPDGGGRRATLIVRGDSATDRQAATETGLRVETEAGRRTSAREEYT